MAARRGAGRTDSVLEKSIERRGAGVESADRLSEIGGGRLEWSKRNLHSASRVVGEAQGHEPKRERHALRHAACRVSGIDASVVGPDGHTGGHGYRQSNAG